MIEIATNAATEVLVNALVAGIIGTLIFLAPRFHAWIDAGATDTKFNTLRKYIGELVDAAEQLFEGEAGEARLSWVISHAREFAQSQGLHLTDDQLRALIEAFVFRNNATFRLGSMLQEEADVLPAGEDNIVPAVEQVPAPTLLPPLALGNLPTLNEERITALQSAGYLDIITLSEADPGRVASVTGIDEEHATFLIDRASAHRSVLDGTLDLDEA